jgi:hypothetical protein
MNDEPMKDAEQASEAETPKSPAAGNRWPVVAGIFFFCAMIAGLAYAVHERNQAGQLGAKYGQMNTALSTAQSQLSSVTAKLNALEAEQAAAKPVTPTPTARQEHVRRRAEAAAHIRRRRAEDPRWKQMQSQLSEQQKQIAVAQQSISQTRADLEGELKSSHDELNGSIAKNHDQLVALAKRSDRNFYEFDLTKSKQYQKVGPIGIALRKANTKHLYCDFKLLVDDNELSKKHVNLDEPVLFYPADYARAVEIVVFKISKNEAKGYVSAPKYRQSELAAQQQPSAGNASPSAAIPATPTAATSAAGLGQRSSPQQ